MLWISLYYSIEPITKVLRVFAGNLLVFSPDMHSLLDLGHQAFFEDGSENSTEPRNPAICLGGGKGTYRLPCCRHKCPNIFYCRL